MKDCDLRSKVDLTSQDFEEEDERWEIACRLLDDHDDKMENIRIGNAALNELKAAIVRRACEDYLYLLKNPGKKLDLGTDAYGRKCTQSLRSLKRWFLSDEFKVLCSVSGEKILAQLNLNHANGIGLYNLEPQKEVA